MGAHNAHYCSVDEFSNHATRPGSVTAISIVTSSQPRPSHMRVCKVRRREGQSGGEVIEGNGGFTYC